MKDCDNKEDDKRFQLLNNILVIYLKIIFKEL